MPLADMKGGGPRVVVSTAAFHARVRSFLPGLGGLKETKMFLPHRLVKRSIVRAQPQTSRIQISNHVSGGQSNLAHLTILRRFSLLNLVCMCTKVAVSPIHFIFIHRPRSRGGGYCHHHVWPCVCAYVRPCFVSRRYL